MDASPRQSWLPVALLAGAGYLIIGRVFAAPTSHVQVWRLAAWLISGWVYLTHIWYEHFRLRNRPSLAATHVAVAVALGAFGLAFVAMLHSRATTSSIRPIWFLAMVLWPAFTAIPAFLGALVAATVLARRR